MPAPTLQYIFHNFGRFHSDLTVLNVAIKTIGLSTRGIVTDNATGDGCSTVVLYERSGQFRKVGTLGPHIWVLAVGLSEN